MTSKSNLDLNSYIKITDKDFSEKYEHVLMAYFDSNSIDVSDCKNALEKWEKYIDLWQRGDGKEWLLRTKKGRKKYEEIFGMDSALENVIKKCLLRNVDGKDRNINM